MIHAKNTGDWDDRYSKIQKSKTFCQKAETKFGTSQIVTTAATSLLFLLHVVCLRYIIRIIIIVNKLLQCYRNRKFNCDSITMVGYWKYGWARESMDRSLSKVIWTVNLDRFHCFSLTHCHSDRWHCPMLKEN